MLVVIMFMPYEDSRNFLTLQKRPEVITVAGVIVKRIAVMMVIRESRFVGEDKNKRLIVSGQICCQPVTQIFYDSAAAGKISPAATPKAAFSIALSG